MINSPNGFVRQKVGTGKRLSNDEEAKLIKPREKQPRKR